MSANGTQPATTNASGGGAGMTFKKGRAIDDVIETPLQSADVMPGQYPARFAGFGDHTIWLKSIFKKGNSNKEGMVEKMNAYFAIRVGDNVRVLSSLVSPPTQAGLSSMSNLYKFVKVLGTGDAALWDGSIDNIKRGAKLSMFKGKTSMAVVDKDKKGFALVKHLVMAPDGVPIPFPTEEETAAALEVFIHSGEAEANIPVDDADVPF